MSNLGENYPIESFTSAILEVRGALTPEDKELVMNLSTVYLKQRETWKLESRQETLETVAIALLREGVDFELSLDRFQWS